MDTIYQMAVSLYGYTVLNAVVINEYEVNMRDQFRMLRLQQLDRGLHSIQNANLPPRPSGGWLASVREALGLTLEEVARRFGTRRPNVLRFEKYEASERPACATARMAGAPTSSARACMVWKWLREAGSP